MAFTVQIPTAFACPNDDIFSLPTKEDLTNAINKIAQVPSKLRVAIVEMGEEITEDVKKEIEDIIKTIEDFIETISEILSPYWKKGKVRNWQKEASDAITEFIQEFHIYIPTKVAELITKIIPISLKIPVFGLTIDCVRLMDKAYQQELQDQIAADVDGFFALLPENMKGWDAESVAESVTEMMDYQRDMPIDNGGFRMMAYEYPDALGVWIRTIAQDAGYGYDLFDYIIDTMTVELNDVNAPHLLNTKMTNN